MTIQVEPRESSGVWIIGYECHLCMKIDNREQMFVVQIPQRSTQLTYAGNTWRHVLFCKDCVKGMTRELSPLKVLLWTGENVK